ncbi:MAG: hypothetical protein GJ676_14955 [Rhodobacteraceae bacterium]|nr:hypothetical protein [Paracoccaceae bacterium]
MNANQIMNMVTRTIMRRLINTGVNAGMNAASSAMSGKGRKGGQRQQHQPQGHVADDQHIDELQRLRNKHRK